MPLRLLRETLSHLISVSHYLNYTAYRECRPFTARIVNVSYGGDFKMGRVKGGGVKGGMLKGAG